MDAPQTNTFTDTAGRAWVLEIHPLAMKRVRERTGVVIGTILDDEFRGLHELYADPCLLADVLYVLVEDQARQHTPPVAAEDFGRSLGRGVMEAAADAFVQALADFSRGQVRGPLLALARKEKEFRAAAAAAAVAEVEGIDVGRLVTTLRNSAGNSQASAGSTAPG